MRFFLQASTLLAVLCLSAPVLASIVNAAPIPELEPMALEARNPSFLSIFAKGFKTVAEVGKKVIDGGKKVAEVGKKAAKTGEKVAEHSGSESKSSSHKSGGILGGAKKLIKGIFDMGSGSSSPPPPPPPPPPPQTVYVKVPVGPNGQPIQGGQPRPGGHPAGKKPAPGPGH